MNLQDFKDSLEQSAIGAGEMKMSRSEALNKGLCLICGEPALPKCYSDAGRREYAISGSCERCFDAMFADEDE